MRIIKMKPISFIYVDAKVNCLGDKIYQLYWNNLLSILIWATMNYSWSSPKHTTFPGFIHALLLAYFTQLTFRAWYTIK